jgi:hypothetical protein
MQDSSTRFLPTLPPTRLASASFPSMEYSDAYGSFRSHPCLVCLVQGDYAIAVLAQDRDWDVEGPPTPDSEPPEWRETHDDDVVEPIWWVELPI